MELDRVIGFSTGKIVFRVGDSVVKLFDGEYSKAEVLNEALNQARMEETGMALPHMLEVTKIQGKWAILSQYIPGDNLEHLMKKHPEKTTEYLEILANLQQEVHQHKLHFLNRMTDIWALRLEQSELTATVRYDLIDRLNQMSKGNVLCHGNLDPQNVILGKDGKTYLLNFSDTMIGNPLGDLAKTVLLLHHSHGEELAEQYLQIFCEKNAVDPNEARKWFAIVAGAELSISKEWIKPLLHQFLETKETAI